MAFILNIDTAIQKASIAISENDGVLLSSSNEKREDHAVWIHTAIQKLLADAGKSANSIDTVAVSNGPGSYTGLRIGLATAKGLCYTLDRPLITIPTTEVLAFGVKEKASDLIIPLIDARRNEVFTAVYDQIMGVKYSPYAANLQPNPFATILSNHQVIFCGDAIEKAKKFIDNPSASFDDYLAGAAELSLISALRYAENAFADLAYAEPLYVKEFQSATGV